MEISREMLNFASVKHHFSRSCGLFWALGALGVLLFAADVCSGAASLPLGTVLSALTGHAGAADTAIVIDIRLIKALTAIIAGVALGVSGLQMQTVFRNPLAGPYVLGVSSGASLGVALFMLGAPVLGVSVAASVGIAGAAWIGAAAVLAVIVAVSRRVKDIMVVLVLGMMFSSAVAAVVQILQYLSQDEALKGYVVWTMGSLGEVGRTELAVLGAACAAGLALGVMTIKELNLLLLGERYARTMGLDVRRSRVVIFTSTVLLAGGVTAFCGPIGFIGLAVPHIARALFRSADHKVVLPASALTGLVVMLLCDIVSRRLALPVNAITSLVGIPVVVWAAVKIRN